MKRSRPGRVLFAVLLAFALAGGASSCLSPPGGPDPARVYRPDPVQDRLGLPPGLLPRPGMLTAGDIDDNRHFAEFREYLERNFRQRSGALGAVRCADRVTVNVRDENGRGVSNARIEILAEGRSEPLLESWSGTDGCFRFFPDFDGGSGDRYFLRAAAPEGGQSGELELDLARLGAPRALELTLPGAGGRLPASLDLMVVMDTTGSMADELLFLTVEFAGIVRSVRQRFPQVDMRFGLILYRDRNDSYVVRDLGFTDSAETMVARLSRQEAHGGGDYPEAMDAALARAAAADWRAGNTARVLLLAADAPPHADRIRAALDQVRLVRRRGIRLYPLAGSGVGEVAEGVMRLAALFTQGRYLFLTDDSGLGRAHREPQGVPFAVTRLDKLIARVIASELAGEWQEADDTEIIRRSDPASTTLADTQP